MQADENLGMQAGGRSPDFRNRDSRNREAEAETVTSLRGARKTRVGLLFRRLGGDF